MEWMLAIQGQNFSAGERAIAVRCGADTAAVQDHLRAGRIVRNWAQRGTWHFVHAPDVTWLTTLRAAWRQNKGMSHRLWHGTDMNFDAVRQEIYQAIRRQGSLSRLECYRIITDLGYVNEDCSPLSTMHRIGHDGHLIPLAREGGEERFTLTELLPHAQRTPPSGVLLLELGVRYASSRGPATEGDLAWWTGAGNILARQALADAVDSGEVITDEYEGTTVYLGAWQQDVTDKELRGALNRRFVLPAFDEYLMAYALGGRHLADEIAPRVLTRNGISWDFVVEAGEVTGPA